MRRPQNLKRFSLLFWRLLCKSADLSKQEGDLFQIFVAFSEKLNFTWFCIPASCRPILSDTSQWPSRRYRYSIPAKKDHLNFYLILRWLNHGRYFQFCPQKNVQIPQLFNLKWKVERQWFAHWKLKKPSEIKCNLMLFSVSKLFREK